MRDGPQGAALRIRWPVVIGAAVLVGLAAGAAVWLLASSGIGNGAPGQTPSNADGTLKLVPTTHAMDVTVHAQRDGKELRTLVADEIVYVVGGSETEGWVRVQVDIQLPESNPESTYGWARSELLSPIGTDPCLHDDDPWAPFAVEPSIRRVCAGGQELRLDGFLVSQEAVSCESRRAYAGEPEWLAERPCLTLSTAFGPAVTGISTGIHFLPGVGIEAPIDQPIHVRVTGHFDDPESETCRRTPLRPEAPTLRPGEAELWCAQQFVVTSIRRMP